ncbi:MAG: GntR family transcriptional regulator [Chloroflexota bacterium]
MTLNKSHPIPLYYQLVEQIREQIQAGELIPGDQLASERRLGEQAGISRMTVRQAVSYLVQDGTLVVKPGVGTFIAAPKLTHDPLHLLGFTEETLAQGGQVTSKVLIQGVVTPSTSITTALSLSTNDLCLKLVRLRFANEMPLLLETIYLPVALCPGLETVDLETGSLYAYLSQRYNLQLAQTRQTLEATVANQYESECFGIEPGMPMILAEGVTYQQNQQPIEYFKAVYRGDRFKFELASHPEVDNTSSSTPRVSVLLET